jgi:hypothetical protein
MNSWKKKLVLAALVLAAVPLAVLWATDPEPETLSPYAQYVILSPRGMAAVENTAARLLDGTDSAASLLAAIKAKTDNLTVCNTGAVTVSSSALPTGAATSAKQDTLIALGESTVRKSTGVTALATTSDAAVEALAADAVNAIHHLRIVNEGEVAGFYSIDGGATWFRLAAEITESVDDVKILNAAIQIKRVAGGSDLADVYVYGW